MIDNYSEAKILINKAIEAQRFSYSPYSKFSVGAALITKTNKIFTGCNIESSSFGATICAERTAIFKALSEGENNFKSIAIVGSFRGKNIEKFCFPCGICRQVLSEFCDKENFSIILFDGNNYKIIKLNDLMPFGFTL